MKIYKKDVDYEFVGIEADPKWAIRILKGKYENLVVRFTDIGLKTQDGSPIGDEFTEESDYVISFNYDILKGSIEATEKDDDERLGQIFGDIIMNAISDGLEDGTAQINEPKSE